MADNIYAELYHPQFELYRAAEKLINFLWVRVDVRFKYESFEEIIAQISAMVGKEPTRVQGFSGRAALISYDRGPYFLFEFEDQIPTGGKVSFANINLVAAPEDALKYKTHLHSSYNSTPSQQASWFYQNHKGEIREATVGLLHSQVVKDEYYPWIEGGLSSYFERFVTDNANVLLLLGEPGTGKTTFIREFIERQNMSTMITHDSGLMEKDELFIRFIAEDSNLLVLEDAEVLIRSRLEGNHIMSKLLNAADGLIRTNKKMILTANVTHAEDIDSALVRPGRCFDILRFRELTAAEASAAAAAGGLIDPKKPATLAQLFKGAGAPVEKKVGF